MLSAKFVFVMLFISLIAALRSDSSLSIASVGRLLGDDGMRYNTDSCTSFV